MENNLPTQQRLKELFIYDPESGIFTRRIATGRHGRHKAGVKAGTPQSHGYVAMHVDGRRYVAHRLAWVYMYGEWPNTDLDHINNVKNDNRIANLRLVTRKQNMQNVLSHKHNTSGFKGVSWHAPRSKWRAYIFCDYRQIYLGLFDTKEAAAAARAEAEKVYHSHRVGK
jgi:hypothetical protein